MFFLYELTSDFPITIPIFAKSNFRISVFLEPTINNVFIIHSNLRYSYFTALNFKVSTPTYQGNFPEKELCIMQFKIRCKAEFIIALRLKVGTMAFFKVQHNFVA